MIGHLFRVRISTTSEIIMECCKTIYIHLKPLVFKKPTLPWIKKIVVEFDVLHEILLILEAINGSYISIIVPFSNPIS